MKKDKRLLKNIYQIVLTELEKETELPTGGLCAYFNILHTRWHLTAVEVETIREHFGKQEPWKFLVFGKHKKFTEHILYKGSAYWWEAFAIEPRKEFIRYLISTL